MNNIIIIITPLILSSLSVYLSRLMVEMFHSPNKKENSWALIMSYIVYFCASINLLVSFQIINGTRFNTEHLWISYLMILGSVYLYSIAHFLEKGVRQESHSLPCALCLSTLVVLAGIFITCIFIEEMLIAFKICGFVTIIAIILTKKYNRRYTTKKFCPYCGRKIDTSSNTCINCSSNFKQ